MTHAPQALVVLLDSDEVRHAFPGWPDIVCLAVCLMRNGDFSTILFHCDERMEVPSYIIEQLGLEEPDVCFVPQTPGFATRPFLYSDQRRLITLIASKPNILDEANDYVVNYTYAIEEGLDPALLLGMRPVAANSRHNAPPPPAKPQAFETPLQSSRTYQAAPAQEKALGPAPGKNRVFGAQPQAEQVQETASRPILATPRKDINELSPLLPEFLRRSAEQRRALRFSTVRKVKADALAASH